MTWTPKTKELPPVGKKVHVYDAMHIGLSTGRLTENGRFEVDNNKGRGTFVTHWCDGDPNGGPDPQEVHQVCRETF